MTDILNISKKLQQQTKRKDMIKNISVLSLALITLISFEVQAQEQAQAEVGNLESSNMMVVEEGYVVESTTPQQASPQEKTRIRQQ